MRMNSGPVAALDLRLPYTATPARRAATASSREELGMVSPSFPGVLSGRGGRDLEPEGRAPTLGALEVDVAAVRLDEGARDREAETAPLASLRPCVAADELTEDLTLELRGDSDAFVLNAHSDEVVIPLPGDADNAAVGRILDCV